MKEKMIVLIAYGHDHAVENFLVCFFEETNNYYNEWIDAGAFCDFINGVEFKDDMWALAQIITEDRLNELKVYISREYSKILKNTDSKVIKELINEVDINLLVKSLKVEKDDLKNIIFSNMAEEEVKNFKENYDFMGPIRLIDINDAQKEIIQVINRIKNK